MGIKGLPTTYDGYLALLVDYERGTSPTTRPTPGSPRRSIRIAPGGRAVVPQAAVRRVTIAMMDEPLRAGARHAARSRAWFVARGATPGLRLRGRLLRFAPPRRTAYAHRTDDVPDTATGWPTSARSPMLDDLNDDKESHA